MPRKPKVRKHPGVYEKVKGSGIWWVRYTNAKGKRTKVKVGTFGNAVTFCDQRKAEIKLGVLLPSAHRRGTKFSDLVSDAIKFSEGHHRAARDFAQRAKLALDEFGNRVADSITTSELRPGWMRCRRNGNGRVELRTASSPRSAPSTEKECGLLNAPLTRRV